MRVQLAALAQCLNPIITGKKFSNPQVLLSHYLAGETLIEAYWKSVAWPAQGLLIGEPLAAPYQKLPLNPEPISSKKAE